MPDAIQVYEGDGTITNKVEIEAKDLFLVSVQSNAGKCRTPLLLMFAQHQQATDAYTTLFYAMSRTMSLLKIGGQLHEGVGGMVHTGYNGMLFPNAHVSNVRMTDAFTVELNIEFDEVQARWTRG